MNPYAAPQAGLELPASPTEAPRLFSWRGRIGRVRFLAYCLAGIGLSIAYAFILGVVEAIFHLNEARLFLAVFAFLPLTTILPAILRRLHDFGVRGWHVWILLVPLFQFIFVIYLLTSPGQEEENEFGPVPVPNSRALVAGTTLGCLALLALIGRRFL